VTKDVEDPEAKISVWKRARLAAEARPAGARGGGGEEGAGSEKRADTRIGALGSGSDYTTFIDHLGVASVNIGFGGEDQGGGQYHSIYDDFYYYSHFQDTTFAYGKALAETGGSIMMRLADADVIPYQFGDQAETIHGYVTEVKKLADTVKMQIEKQNKAIADGAYAAAADPTKTSVPPAVQAMPPALDFTPLEKASADLTAAAAAYDKALEGHAGGASAGLNAELLKTEHALTDPQGLPNREWFKNMVYAPGFYTGYGVKTLPAVRESIEQKEWPMVDPEIVRTAAAIEREVDVLKAATKMLQ
jgi:N-acetylated-alpha-linked acidic dipeptidase